MITKVRIKNFKRFDDVEVELGRVVLFIGPNNYGKTTALQALALWDAGLRRWNEKRKGDKAPEKRPGVTINRKELTALPIPVANLLWRDQHVREVNTIKGKPSTKNIRIDIIVDGITNGNEWKCGLEFDYANEESFYCRPLRLSEEKSPERMPIPDEAASIRFAYLPPMSGLASNEILLPPGNINVKIGEGRTAEVLRNLCYRIFMDDDKKAWNTLCDDMKALFGMELEEPEFIKERGEIAMSYKERGIRLDLSCCGRGAHQTMLLLSYIYANSGSVLLLDEPDAHLEILRQGQIYEKLTKTSENQNSQVIAASHSEKLLIEAAQRDVVVAFLGANPHRIDDRGSQLLKSLREIGFDQYYQAEQKGWVLYLEGSTDLAILRSFAGRLGHPSAKHLEQPFVNYVGNIPEKARSNFRGLCESRKDFLGIAIFDRLDKALEPTRMLNELMWQKCEIENYVSQRETLLAYAEAYAAKEAQGPLFEGAEKEKSIKAMEDAIDEISQALKKIRRPLPFTPDIKASDHFLDPLFEAYFEKLGLPNLMKKTNYHILAELVPNDLIEKEVVEKLDAINEVAAKAKPGA
jgi:hypothetical protein